MLQAITIAALLVTPSSAQDAPAIISTYCLGCHASQVKMGGLALDTQEGIDKGGNHGTIVVPGKPEESRLYLMVSGKAKPSMPADGRSLAAGEIEAIRKWIESGAKLPDGKLEPAKAAAIEIKPTAPVKPQIFSMAWRPDGKMIALGGHKEVRLVDAATHKEIAKLAGHAADVRALAFSHDGKLLAAGGGLPARSGEVKIWDIESRNAVATIQGHSDCIYAVAFSPDGKQVATSSYDKLIKLWDAASAKEVRTFKDHIDAVYALAFTPDGKRIVSGAADRTVKVWDAATGERLYTMGEPIDGINSIALDPTGRMVAAGGVDKNIRVWSLGERGATLLHTLIAHEDAILRLAWSPDGKVIASSAADRTIKLFQADELAEIKTYAQQPDWVYALEFSPDGKSFAAGRFDGSLTFYPVAPASTAAIALR